MMLNWKTHPALLFHCSWIPRWHKQQRCTFVSHDFVKLDVSFSDFKTKTTAANLHFTVQTIISNIPNPDITLNSKTQFAQWVKSRLIIICVALFCHETMTLHCSRKSSRAPHTPNIEIEVNKVETKTKSLRTSVWCSGLPCWSKMTDCALRCCSLYFIAGAMKIFEPENDQEDHLVVLQATLTISSQQWLHSEETRKEGWLAQHTFTSVSSMLLFGH